MNLREVSILRKIPTSLLAIGILGIGIVGLLYLVWTHPQPAGDVSADPGRLVRAFRAEPVDHQVSITAYGTARASQEWDAIAETPGRAVFVDPLFESGELLPKGTLLLRIDPTDYQIAVQRYEAEVSASRHALEELDQNEENLKASLTLLERQLELSEAEFKRNQDLFKKGQLSQSRLDEKESNLVQRRISTQDLRNQLDLIPIQRESLRASRDLSDSNLKRARNDLAKTEIRLPFPARCASKSIEENQYAAAGQVLGNFIALDKAEVVVQVEGRKLRMLWPKGIPQAAPLTLSGPDQDRPFWETTRIDAEVSWSANQISRAWKGHLARIGSSLDPETRTIPLIIEVPDPYKDLIPGVRPPLLPDMFCEVRIYGDTREGVYLLPRDCIHDGRVYLIREGKLAISEVRAAAFENGVAVAEEGLHDGDVVVLTDVFPAAVGTPLRPQIVPNPALSNENTATVFSGETGS